MKHSWRVVAIGLFSLGTNNVAACESSFALEGSASVETCDVLTEGCIPGSKALHDYLEKVEDDPTTVTIGLQASPWRMYDADMRIVTTDEMAEMLRPHIEKGAKQAVLFASWSGVRPSPERKSIIEELSASLDGFPVRGMDGFLWINDTGVVRTTRQAFTIKKGSGPYGVPAGREVMASLVAGWWSELEDLFTKEGDAVGIMMAGAGWDIYYLCPDRALSAFEAAAKLSHPIAAYNAALMRLGRREEGDVEAAMKLLSQAASLGDEKARSRLKSLH